MAFWSQQRFCLVSPLLSSPNREHGSFVENFNLPCVSSLAAFVTHKCHFQSVHLQFLGPQLWAAITIGSHSCPPLPRYQHPNSAVPAHPAGYPFLRDSAWIPPGPGAPFTLLPRCPHAVAAVFTFSLQLELALGHRAWCWLLVM